MNGARDRRESVSSSHDVSDSNKDDEAALIDSLFMPGGILDGNQDIDNNPNLQPIALPEKIPTTTTTATTMDWSSTPSLFSSNPNPMAAAGEGRTADLENSFWSGAAGVNTNTQSPWPVASSSIPSQTPISESFLNGSSQSYQQQENDGVAAEPLLGAAPSLFAYGNNFGSYTDNNHQNPLINQALGVDDVSDCVAVVPNAAGHPLHNTQPMHLAPLLATDGGGPLVVSSCSKPPAKSAQEEEDVRQMVLALSSSLQNLGGDTSDHHHHPLPPVHLLLPDSPPKIIRQRSSLSASRGPRASLSSIPLELPPEGHGDNGDGLGNGENEELDHVSTTSSLSSGSAERNESPTPMLSTTTTTSQEHGHRQHSSSLVGELSRPLRLQEQQGQQQQQQHTYGQAILSQPQPPPAMSSLPTTFIPPPPGYHNLQHQQRNHQSQPLQFPKNDDQQTPQAKGATDFTPQPQRSLPPPPGIHAPPGIMNNIKSRSNQITNQPSSPPKSKKASVLPRLQIPKAQKQYQPPPQEAFKAVRRRNTTTTLTHSPSSRPIELAAGSTTHTTTPRRRKPSRSQRQQQEIVSPAIPKSNDISHTTSSPADLQQSQRDTIRDSRNIAHQSDRNNGDSSNRTPHIETSPSAPTKQRGEGFSFVWSQWVVDSIAFGSHFLRFGVMLLSLAIQEAAKEAAERPMIAGFYALLYMTPGVSYVLMDYYVWLPHYFPGITMGTALWCICRQILDEADPSLILEADSSLVSPSSEQENASNTTSLHVKKKSRPATSRQPTSAGNNNINRDPSSEALRVQELRSMEAKICHIVLTNLRWSLPVLVFIQFVVSTPSEEECQPSMRLVAAFGLSTLKTYNLLSPVAWISGSLQVLFILGMRNSQTYMQRWYGVEIMVASLGLATLRFLRLGGARRKQHV